MTNRYQNQRSTISGNLPASGTRLPGEIWVNFPDLQLGLIDASKTAQRLIAVRYFSTTATYAAGDMVVQAGALYVANGVVPPGAFTATQWTKVSTAADLAGYLPLIGGTMTGPIVSVTGDSINGAAGTARSLFGTTAASKRWELQLGGPSAEGGANAGSNFNLIAYNDAGAVLSTPMSIARATGAVTFGGSVTIPSLTLAALDNTPIGQTTPAAGSFTALTATSLNGGPLAGMRNKIINGDMRVDQYHNHASFGVTAATIYPVADRYSFYQNVAKFNYVYSPVTGGPPGFPNYAQVVTTATPYTPAAGDVFFTYHRIEGQNIQDLQWGTPQALPVTLSFWAATTNAGTYSGALQNGAGNRSYPFTFVLPANNWTKIAITVPGDTTGTWAIDNTIGIGICFDMGCGSTSRGPANAWAGAAYNGVTGTASLVSQATASFNLTGLQLEPGTVATPFERRPIGTELALCQRYYQFLGGASSSITIYGYNLAGNPLIGILSYPTMRAVPTATQAGTWTNGNLASSTFATMFSGVNMISIQTAAVSVTSSAQVYNTAGAGITLSAEL
jgi:hypothetical protein